MATLASVPPDDVPSTPAPPLNVHAPPDNPPPASVTGCDADAVVVTASVPAVVRISSLLTRLRIVCVPVETRIVGLAATEIVTSSPAPGSTLPLQLALSVQLTPSPPPSQLTAAIS